MPPCLGKMAGRVHCYSVIYAVEHGTHIESPSAILSKCEVVWWKKIPGGDQCVFWVICIAAGVVYNLNVWGGSCGLCWGSHFL